MAKQSEAPSTKKRKSSKGRVDKEKDKKRKRSAPEEQPTPEEALLKTLTGEDEHLEHAPDQEPSIEEGVQGESDEGVESEHREKNKSGDAATQDGGRRQSWRDALSEAHASKMNVTVLLENANLETVKQSGRSGGMVLLNCDDHRHILKKTNREANDARPDITHQCLLALMDSPLNKAGKLKVFVRTSKNVLIEIHPQTRIPRTTKRFAGLMAELLEKLKVRGTSGATPLLRVIRNPITSHLPVGTQKIVCTYNTEKVVDVREHAAGMSSLVLERGDGGAGGKGKVKAGEIEDHGQTVNVLYVVGAMAHGKITEEWADEYMCMSEYPLSAATVCSRITYAYESLFGIM